MAGKGWTSMEMLQEMHTGNLVAARELRHVLRKLRAWRARVGLAWRGDSNSAQEILLLSTIMPCPLL